MHDIPNFLLQVHANMDPEQGSTPTNLAIAARRDPKDILWRFKKSIEKNPIHSSSMASQNLFNNAWPTPHCCNNSARSGAPNLQGLHLDQNFPGALPTNNEVSHKNRQLGNLAVKVPPASCFLSFFPFGWLLD